MRTMTFDIKKYNIFMIIVLEVLVLAAVIISMVYITKDINKPTTWHVGDTLIETKIPYDTLWEEGNEPVSYCGDFSDYILQNIQKN